MVKSRSCQDHGVVVCPLRGVAPPRPGRVPVMAPRWITNDTLWKTLPYDKSKVHLRGGEMKDRHQANRLQRRTDKKQDGKGEKKEGTVGKGLEKKKFCFNFCVNVCWRNAKVSWILHSVLHMYPSHICIHSSILCQRWRLNIYPLSPHQT